MTKHQCPYNSKFKFDVCDKTKCPYHTHRSTAIFNIKEASQCIKIDAPEIVLALSDDSLSSIDRTNFAKVNHRRIRRDIEETLLLSKSVISIFNEVPINNYCKRCGAPTECGSSSACDTRLEWINKAKQALCIGSDNTVLYANIWNLLQKGKLYLNNAVMERHGRALIPSGVNKAGQERT